jgi:beta-glucanase (GH16 family)
MKISHLFIFLCCLVQNTFAQKKPDTLFYDNFTGKTINRDKWNVEATGYTFNGYIFNHEQQAYVDSANVLLVANGLLHIKPRYLPGYTTMQQKLDFLSGRINTRGKFMFTYGTISARIKSTAGDGLWPTFWIIGDGNWPECGESDIMENIGDPSWTNHAVHGPGYSGATPLLQRNYFAKGTDVTKWHVYTLNWTADKLTFSIDGAVTYAVTKEMVEKYGRWVFDSPKFITLNLALGGDYPYAINHVTTPYHGLPQSTVDQVKAGKADLWVDWVLVTRN